MAELYFPFASVSGDRKVGPEIYERMLGDMFTAGVFPRGEMLAVAPASGMQITLKTGGAVLIRTDATSAGPRGYLYSNTAAQTLTCNVADGVAGRIDAVVLRWSRTARSVTAAIVTGTPAATPTAPTPKRTADIWELCLAQISVAAGATEITAAQITDTRETELCGIASSIAQLDSADFYAQQTAVFDAWFKSIKDTLEGDPQTALISAVGQLRADVDALTGTVGTKADKSVVKTFLLPASGWTGDGLYTQAVTVAGVTADTNAVMDYTHGGTADAEKPLAKAWSCITKFEAGAGKVTATCLSNKPESNLTVRMMIIG